MYRQRKNFNVWKYILALIIIAVHFVPIYMVLAIAFKSPYDHSSRWAFPGYVYVKNLYAAFAYFGAFGYELDLNRLSEEEQEAVRKQVLYYKDHGMVTAHGD